MKVQDLPTPALLIDGPRLEANLTRMAAALPGARLRPHVKAHKCTSLARRQRAQGHSHFCCATVREMEGMARAGLGDDLLLANETLRAERLGVLARSGARISVAVDSPETIEAAKRGGVREVLIDVNVGLPRCGCAPEEAGRLADLARRLGLEVRGVMGYEGHIVGQSSRTAREQGCEASMERLLRAHATVGGEVLSAGGTGTYDCNRWATEIQAGSYALMDTAYAALDLPFVQAVSLLSTVISVSSFRGNVADAPSRVAGDRFAVADAGLKSLGMDHGNPSIPGARVLFCSDEHVTFVPGPGEASEGSASPIDWECPREVRVGDRMRIVPAHLDPTVAYHEMAYVTDGDQVIDQWEIDLRGW